MSDATAMLYVTENYVDAAHVRLVALVLDIVSGCSGFSRAALVPSLSPEDFARAVRVDWDQDSFLDRLDDLAGVDVIGEWRYPYPNRLFWVYLSRFPRSMGDWVRWAVYEYFGKGEIYLTRPGPGRPFGDHSRLTLDELVAHLAISTT